MLFFSMFLLMFHSLLRFVPIFIVCGAEQCFPHFLRTIAKGPCIADGMVCLSRDISQPPSSITLNTSESILTKRMKEWKYAYVIQCQMQKGFIFFPFTPIRNQIGGAHEIRLSFSFYRNITNVNDCTVTYLTVHLGRASTSTDEERTNFTPSNDKFASWSSEIATHLHHYKFYWSCDDKKKYGWGNDVFVSVLQNTVQEFIRYHQMLFFFTR